MKRLILALLLLCGVAQAADPDFTFIVRGGRYFLVTIEDGIPVNHPVTVRFVPFEGNSPNPTPDPQPDPDPDPVLTERAKAIRSAALLVTGDVNRARTALELATLYSEIAKKVRAGEIKTPTLILAVVKGSTDELLRQRNAVEPWKGTREVLSAQWAALLQEGGTDEQFAELLDEAADGLEDTLSKLKRQEMSKAKAIDIQMIIRIILMILELLNKSGAK